MGWAVTSLSPPGWFPLLVDVMQANRVCLHCSLTNTLVFTFVKMSQVTLLMPCVRAVILSKDRARLLFFS